METYGFNIVPYECTTGYDSTEKLFSELPVVYFQVGYGLNFRELEYMDYQHQPIMIQNTDDVTEFEIMVDYNWFGSPRRDFTVKVYALDVSDIRDEDGDTNMLHTDGQSPSEFNYVEDEWPEGRDASEPETPVIFNRFLDGYTGCKDTNIDATDSYGDDCKWYVVDTFCG